LQLTLKHLLRKRTRRMRRMKDRKKERRARKMAEAVIAAELLNLNGLKDKKEVDYWRIIKKFKSNEVS
jgi:hypothetical protein